MLCAIWATFSLLSLILYLVVNYKKQVRLFQICYDIVIILATSFLSCYFILSGAKSIGYFIICYYACYILLTTIVKAITFWVLNRQYKGNEKKLDKKKDHIEKLYFIFISPDYAITDVFKQNCVKEENGKSKEKAKLIQAYNIINLVITTIFCCLCYFIKSEILLTILIIRIVYRCIEIIFAFGKDITSEAKTSSLRYNDRIKLAILSIVEVLLFAIGYANISSSKKSTPEILIRKILFQDSLCQPIDVLLGMTGLVLIGIVVTQYVSSLKDND